MSKYRLPTPGSMKSEKSPKPLMGGNCLSTGSIALICAGICLLVFLRALSCGFVNIDDPFVVIRNPDIKNLDLNLLYRAFIDPQDLWIPLAWLSLALDHAFWGLNPAGYHLTGILLHSVNTGLVVLIAARMFQGQGDRDKGRCIYPFMLLLAGLLWGLHPLRVESVVWVSERKDVLNGFFTFTAVLSYLRYVERRGSGASAQSFYLLSLALFACSLMSKSVTVVLPLMLLVLDRYPLGRLQREQAGALVVEKLPFLALSVVSAVLTIYFASHNSMLVAPETFPLLKRLIVSGNAIIEYLRLILLPVGIIHLYLIPSSLPLSYYIKAVFAVVLILFALKSVTKHPRFSFSLLLFLLPLLPVLAFFQNGGQAFAARYTYLPSVSIAIVTASLIGAGLQAVAGSATASRLAASAAVLAVVSYAGVSYSLTGTWKNTATLWSRYIEVRPMGSAYYFRSCYYKETGEYSAAARDLSVSIAMAENAGMTEVFKLYALRGDAYLRGGSYGEAVQDFSSAIALAPRPAFYYYRGLAREALGDRDAEQDIKQAAGEVGPIEWYVEPVVK